MTHDPVRGPEPVVTDSEATDPSETEQTRSVSDAAAAPESGNGRREPSATDRDPHEPLTDAPAEGEEQPPPAAEQQPAEQVDDEAAEPAEAYALAGEELQALAERAGQAEEYLALAQRTQADFENYRRRAARDAAIAKERGATKLARELLPAVDNLERALAHVPEDADADDDDGFVAGVRHVHSDVIAALQRVGIEPYSPEGEPFDPQLHEAVAQQPVDGCASGTVVEVFQRGYRIGETVLRPARVVVAG